jgi:predicted acyltransferase
MCTPMRTAFGYLAYRHQSFIQGEGFPFDPEGLLSTFPSIGNIVGAILLEDMCRKTAKHLKDSPGFLWRVYIVCNCILWNYGFPINKKLWTSSLYCIQLD